MNETLEYVKSFARFPLSLRRFLQRGLSLEQADQIVRERIHRREENFLRIAERGIYSDPDSPYLALLKLAQCEFGDLQALVRREGLEAALRSLRNAGVYVTFEEFKGRTPIVRGGRTIPTTSRSFDNHCARRDFALQTGGSTGLAASVNQDLDFIGAGAAHHMLLLSAWGVLHTPVVHWLHKLPGSGMHFILQRAYFSRDPQRWFAPIGWRDSKYWIKYGAATVYMVFWMRAMGVPVSLPEIVRADQALVVARAIREILNAGRGCLLYANTSQGMRVCLAAEEAKLDLTGATVRVGGEPITSAKAEAMRRAGVRILPAYGAIDAGAIGLACSNGAQTDDVHFCRDAFALITHPRRVAASQVEVPALNLTSLTDTSPKIMLNYESDDYAVVQERRCGCPLEAYGFNEHLHGIRSYSKLVGEGVSFIGDEMLAVLEHQLPARFGGSPLDYQMMEQEDAAGFTRLYLVIDPRVKIADEGQVVEFVLTALTNSSPMGDGVRRVWQQSRTLQVKRMKPVATAAGKLLPLHIVRPESHR